MTVKTFSLPAGVELAAPPTLTERDVLTHEALAFVAKLARLYEPERQRLLTERAQRQARLDAGEKPDFLQETAAIRSEDWVIAPVPKDLQDRRVEITGPVDRKMIINALNCGARVFMADFEDSTSPTWENVVQGQANLRDAVNGTIAFVSPEGKEYRLNPEPATLMVRPRGWHLDEAHMRVDGQPVSASLFDFGLYFFHNAQTLIKKGSGPYFYLPKLENHREARLWNRVFETAQELLGIPCGTIKATVLIETILAAFEMHEILYELRDHSAGLNCGRWDYIFSCIKKFRNLPDFVLADRSLVTMTTPFMRAYSLLTIQTCHRRGAHAMGGMAAQIPIKHDQNANEQAMARVLADKEREAEDGHDGTWVAHPGLVPLAMRVFDAAMTGPHQIARKREELRVMAADLLQFEPEGPITEMGVRTNIQVGIRYLGAWLSGNGCVPIFNLMEDAATAEISRSQIWQWIHSPKGVLEDGRKITADQVSAWIAEELDKIRQEMGEENFARIRYAEAADLFKTLSISPDFSEFLTIPAYHRLIHR